MNDYPNTYQLSPSTDPRVQYPPIFDPALKQFPDALRRGEPSFHNLGVQQRWFQARRQVIQHLLGLIGRSRWSEHLVLHGSVLLATWLGDLGREPAGIDWVFRPDEIVPKSPLAQKLLEDLIQMVTLVPQADWVTLDVENIVTDTIWMDERQEGQRILFPWTANGIPSGFVQMDVVFGTPLPEKPIHTLVNVEANGSHASYFSSNNHEKDGGREAKTGGVEDVEGADGDRVSLWAVRKSTVLAWKVLWLETDLYPQGHDLYDASLLAEDMLVEHILTESPLSTSTLLRHVLQSNENWRLEVDYAREGGDPWQSNFPWVMELDCLDWGEFQQEHPWVRGTVDDWITRLSNALHPLLL